MQEKQQSASWTKQTLYAQVSPKSQATEVENFLNDYDEADEKERRRLSLTIYKWNYEKMQILAVSDITTTVAPLAHRWQRQKENKLPPSLSKISPWWGLGNRQWRTVVKQLSKCLSSLAVRSVFPISKRQHTSCILTPSFHNRGPVILKTLTFADYCKRSYL